MDRLWGGLTALAQRAIIAGCALLFIAALIVTAEVMIRSAIPGLFDLIAWIARKLSIDPGGLAKAGEWVRINLAFSGSDEMSGYLFAVGTSWSMAHVLITRGHVRIDALYGSFSPMLRAVLDIVALIFLAIFVGALLERAFNVSTTNLIEYNRSNTNLRIPLSWPQIPWLAGIALFFVTIIMAILVSLRELFSGNFAAVNALAGASTQDEEIEGELKGLGIETPHGGKQ